ncbi:3D-(3,5/4)-trihydroxycyclohexane-1,2-dione acylhydrolase (decyclizing) [Nakamurella flavida]|uniref:3D-(3,5/4)-trihydroxycyclohexane-1,2-dione acylhydrolase (Decyclizing) n=1 Tax=Nakamurella flavida TaxID=363630 RepID=A0A938YLC6_9ACTN|nr:3D-(3,5/4)-trihydroxycyclohexane-1,2-dione acylhydrolase (decyclizing) [Nakamurella flavida]MBM9477294.1 3D-(3,5/4)-trihydroxycyclohexane-1,2-dione acylhydrolase (decyclizing) [Nakamurella flavida]MDP9779750.1 3D-(3,5/4)-trihydroxycyclohexane-1,2-dione acylhydrolase (decyclizing) [Nakamurella flavida]
MTTPTPATERLTVAQAVVKFLGNQYTERDGVRRKFFAGCFGIFGHGNVAGLGQALLQAELETPDLLPYHQGRNEQAMVHIAVGYARQQDRLQAFAVTASVGPGASNMLTGAALATINRLPVLLLPSDIFATRIASPVLQELEQPYGYDVSVNDAFRPLSKFFDRVWRPEQLAAALLGAMRVLTDPAETGAVTIALPEDVQAEAFDFPVELFRERTWRIGRPVPEPEVIAAAAELIRGAKAPVIVAGGGVTYAEANDALRAFVEATGIPSTETQAGKGSLPFDHPLNLGAVGATGNPAANLFSRRADVVIGIGTRYSDFTTASKTIWQNPDVQFVNINVASLDAVKHAGLPVVADARRALEALTTELAGYGTSTDYRTEATTLAVRWDAEVVDSFHSGYGAEHGILAQAEVLGAVDEVMDARDVVVCAAGSLPGDLHGMWRTRDRKGYHVEYGFSCMGYEIPGGIGVRMAAPDRDVFVTVGDGSYLMMPTELVTAVQEGIKIIVVLLQNHGYASIGSLAESLGVQRFGTKYRYRDEKSGRLDGGVLPVDLAANAESLGVTVFRASTLPELQEALAKAKAHPTVSLVHVDTDLEFQSPAGDGWWDVPVAEVSTLESTRQARLTYEQHKADQRPYL